MHDDEHLLLDDETLTEDDIAGLDESAADVAAGRDRPADEVLAELGI